MSTKERKLEIIERILHLSSEEELSTIEQVLEVLAVAVPGEEESEPMPFRNEQELADRLTQARADVKAGRVFSQEEVVALTQKWRAA